MKQQVKRHLKIGATPHLDEEWLIIRMHEINLPQGLNFGDYIRVTINNKCVVGRLSSNAMAEIKHPREHQISLNKHLRQILGIKPGITGDFYVSKATSLKAPFYTIRYHPSSTARKKALWQTIGVISTLITVILLLVLYFLMWR